MPAQSTPSQVQQPSPAQIPTSKTSTLAVSPSAAARHAPQANTADFTAPIMRMMRPSATCASQGSITLPTTPTAVVLQMRAQSAPLGSSRMPLPSRFACYVPQGTSASSKGIRTPPVLHLAHHTWTAQQGHRAPLRRCRAITWQISLRIRPRFHAPRIHSRASSTSVNAATAPAASTKPCGGPCSACPS